MRIYAAFRDSVAAMASDGVNVIVDDAMVGAASDQRLWNESLADLEVCWVGVHCSPDTATAREAAARIVHRESLAVTRRPCTREFATTSKSIRRRSTSRTRSV